MPHQQVNGIDLYYELHGPETADVIVLSNGIFMSTASWGFQVAELKKHFRVLVYDCRGMWQSDHPAGPYSMEMHADDLAGLLTALHIEKAHIAGISYGGEISMVFALKYPGMVRSLILSSTVSQIDPMLRKMGDLWVSAIEKNDPDALFEASLPLNFSEAWLSANEGILEASCRKYHQMDLQAAGELMRAFSKVNFTADLGQIKAPTLVLVGELDILKPRKYAEIIAAAIPGAELAIIPHAGHAACLEQPAMFNTLVLGFVAKHCEVPA
ncbi:MAG TPA: alpha/beta fold hydrolase [Anaerolineaceae bacterium]|nr:alpha/beta fold hydrolase [Anaerolineaceae bacterium]